MNKLLPKTLSAAEALKSDFKCLSCHQIPAEPYFTGVCDHLLCHDCIFKSNLCPICCASFYKTEAYLSKMIREAILSVNTILELTNGTYKPPEKYPAKADTSLPELMIEESPTTPKNKADASELKMKPPLIPPLKLETPKPKAKVQRNNSAKSRTKSIGRPKAIKNDNSTQLTPSQLGRSQSVRHQKKNNKGELPIHLAVMKEDEEEFKRLLETDIDVNVRDNAGWTPLHEACNKGHLDMVERLLKHGADIDAFGYQNNTPLHEAALNKKMECVKFLIASGANQNLRNLFGILAKDFVKNSKEFAGIFESKCELTDSMSQRVHEVREVQMASNNFEITSSISKRTRREPKKKMVLFGTGMNNAGKINLAKLASKLNLQVSKTMNNNVTHVIYNTNKTCSRSLNYMKAILMGIWIVSIEWLENSVINNSVLEENEFEAEGSMKMITSNGPFQGRMNASCQYPRLFEDCYFYLHGKFDVFEKLDFLKLLELAGAHILKREPKMTNVEELKQAEMPQHLNKEENAEFCCAYYILFDVDKPVEINHMYLKTVRPKWLFECIDQFKILEPKY